MNLAAYIDHTLLRADARKEEILQLCTEAADHGFHSVCINPYWVSLARDILATTPVKVCTVVGFPLGATTAETKRREALQAVIGGAGEVDMVLNIGALKGNYLSDVKDDISYVAEVVHGGGGILKVILETCLLSDAEKEQAAQIAVEAGTDFVKTSTGFSTGGATVEDVALLRRVVGPDIGVKASGGIRTTADALRMIHAGANRLGCSASLAIVQGAPTPGGNAY